MSTQSPEDAAAGLTATTGSPTDTLASGGPSADLATRLDQQRKILDRILNATMVTTNVAREVRAEGDATAEKLKTTLTELAQAGERRDAKTHATFDGFQRAFREEISALRGSITTVLREQAFLEMAGSWMSVLDDVDALGRVSNEQGAGAWAQALQTLANRIVSVFGANGLSMVAIVPGETRFDPEWHEAAPPATPAEAEEAAKSIPGVIVAVHARGFQYRERLLRCARVVVAPARESRTTTEKER